MPIAAFHHEENREKLMDSVGEPYRFLIIIGGLLLAGLIAHVAGRRTPLPRATLLILLGVTFGPSGFDLLGGEVDNWFPIVADMALVMIGFLLGERLTAREMSAVGKPVLIISLVVVGATAAIVGGGLVSLDVPVSVALLLASIATATDPAATVDVTREIQARGPFSSTVLGIVALDDVWGLIPFSFVLAIAGTTAGAVSWKEILASGVWEIGGAICLGVILGIPMAYLTGRIEAGEPMLAEALGVVFLCGGIALWLKISFLLAAITLGATVANFAKHHTRPFHAIEGVDAPFLILFFILAGASLEIDVLLASGTLGLAYIFLRSLSRIAGGWLGGRLGGMPPVQRNWMGMALVPQAGVAVGMALLVAERFPEMGRQVLPVVIGSTVVFEVVGPIATRVALRRVGEA